MAKIRQKQINQLNLIRVQNPLLQFNIHCYNVYFAYDRHNEIITKPIANFILFLHTVEIISRRMIFFYEKRSSVKRCIVIQFSYTVEPQ